MVLHGRETVFDQSPLELKRSCPTKRKGIIMTIHRRGSAARLLQNGRSEIRCTAVVALAGIAATTIVAATKYVSKGSVVVNEGTNVNATVSPDHKTIIMDLQEALWSLPIAGGTAKRLTDPFLEPARPDWSPKGDWIAFQSFKGVARSISGS